MTVPFYPIIPIADDAPELPEQLGTKTKYWLHIDAKRYLLKIGRANTGENWAEKVACELCSLLGLPHAHYEFALWKHHKCIVSETIVPKDGRLIMGNELLSEIHINYPTHQRYQVSDHTFGRIHALLNSSEILLPLYWVSPGDGIKNAFDVFVGYLLLDAWIANQDRHHENWGEIAYNDAIFLAPTYDHAASMGQNETDQVRKDRLKSRDPRRHISAYVEKARSAIYLNKTEQKPLSTVRVFEMAAERSPNAASCWREMLGDISKQQCLAIFEKIPSSEISEAAIEFAVALLELNKQRILKE
ncbi:phosphatidylinositol kinase [Methylomonas sp. OY6]|uniref:Phosphatidylinositol kinase n=1 Tax=Methylomonas defluvii TaxID=3045149 RepID=A0ABU4UGG1_9GAMM|nr:phosphatidylinositol kinase [Methylomonas sp. OY6]MDX8127977.1 phosphatidylinositol kinase [Methylomonas sp. OY6]